MTSIPPPTGIVLISKSYQRHLANRLARMRMEGHALTRKPHEDLGKHAFRREFYGVLAELLVLDALQRDGHRPEGIHILAVTAPVGPDFRLHRQGGDIKAVLPGNKYVCINERQRIDPRHEVDYYLPVAFIRSGMARVYAPVPADKVAAWQPMDNGHDPYRSIDVSELPLLQSWKNLP
jgi:hypothetical protein